MSGDFLGLDHISAQNLPIADNAVVDQFLGRLTGRLLRGWLGNNLGRLGRSFDDGRVGSTHRTQNISGTIGVKPPHRTTGNECQYQKQHQRKPRPPRRLQIFVIAVLCVTIGLAVFTRRGAALATRIVKNISFVIVVAISNRWSCGGTQMACARVQRFRCITTATGCWRNGQAWLVVVATDGRHIGWRRRIATRTIGPGPRINRPIGRSLCAIL